MSGIAAVFAYVGSNCFGTTSVLGYNFAGSQNPTTGSIFRKHEFQEGYVHISSPKLVKLKKSRDCPPGNLLRIQT